MTKSAAVLALQSMLLILAACSDKAPQESGQSVRPDPILIVDTHIDVPYRLKEHFEDVTQATATGDFDYPRAVAGGLGVAFMSVYVPAELQEPGKARPEAETLVQIVQGIEQAAPEKFGIARDSRQALELVSRGKIALAMGMENGAGLEDDLSNVAYFRDQGISYITLTHAKPNLICDSSYDPERPWGGLSPFGRRVVEEMNRVGIMVDVSHVSDETFWQVMDISAVPVIASHSSARHFTPGFERNMSDDMIRRLAQDGGVIQINFGSAFLTGESNQWFVNFLAAQDSWITAQEVTPAEDAKKVFETDYRSSHPMPYASLDDVLNHIDYVVKLGGVEHVGIGSDFDGVGDSLPTGLKDVSAYPNLIDGLGRRGYTDDDIRKIMGANL
ncbi:MAG: dipeptidase, partial [Gammaproteobacteria bacterium]|nr:dipeptidase [Gammaproteobacteria bacterium]